ncbi:MAG: SixA phosphatase family protein [Flammeovirgaceae bacterium]
MKNLYLIRHAKSSWDNPDRDDFDRPLNERGEKDAPRVGRRLKEKKLTPDIVVSSPAIRALETCKIICEALDFDKTKIIEHQSLYHASEEEILKVVRSLKDRKGDKEENVLLFGHNPGLTDFANRLLNEYIVNIPTSGIVAAQLNIDKWSQVEWSCGKLLFFDFPKSNKN